jgi:hypothetical protein
MDSALGCACLLSVPASEEGNEVQVNSAGHSDNEESGVPRAGLSDIRHYEEGPRAAVTGSVVTG